MVFACLPAFCGKVTFHFKYCRSEDTSGGVRKVRVWMELKKNLNSYFAE